MSLERRFNFRYLLAPEGWLRDHAVVVDGDGRIRALEPASGPWTGTLAVPGLPDAHSHVFQRALAGHGEARRGGDSFWSWRDAMYALAARLDAETLYVIARHTYGGMLAAGFTSVAEFHYLHHRPDGAHGTETAQALVAAAREAGIRLKLLPVLYQRGGFDRPAAGVQQRFVHERLEDFLALLEALAPHKPGVAFHSLRAVAPEAIAPALAGARAILGDGAPVHIHVAEQRREVEECMAATGRRPVDLLFESAPVDPRWSLVHATHATPAELERIAASGATVVVCPLTEAALGDGLFRGRTFFAAGGAVAVGSDSNARLDAIEELRWLEYGQRLADEARARLADAAGLGEPLWRRVAEGGARSLAQTAGAIAPGSAADFVVLEPETDALLGLAPGQWLDALIASGGRGDLAAVYVGGERRVEHGEWSGRADSARRYDASVRRLWETS